MTVSNSQGVVIGDHNTVVINAGAEAAPARWSRRARLALAGGTAVLLLLLAGGGWWYARRIVPMGPGFNLGVAMFAERGPGGSLQVTDFSRQVSAYLFEAIDREAKNLPASLAPGRRGPDEIGPVTGSGPAERYAAARKAAGPQAHNLTLLVYGVVEASEQGGTLRYRITPEFYVSEDEKGFYEVGQGSDVSGPQRLGRPVEVPAGADLQASQALLARTQALRGLITGLAYIYAGDPPRASQEFESALQTPNWQDADGREVAYLLAGQAHLERYDPLTRVDQLAEAEADFQHAGQINPAYARPYLGLGEISLQQATFADSDYDGLLSPTQRAEMAARLQAAGDAYTQAIRAGDQPDQLLIQAKAAFGLGRAHMLGAQYGLPGWSAEHSRQYFEQLLAADQLSGGLTLAWQAAYAHAGLGRLLGLYGDYPGMSAACRQAVQKLGDLPGPRVRLWQARYWECVAMAEESAGQAQPAVLAYCQALQTAGQPGAAPAAEEVQRWQDHVARLGGTCP